MLQPSVMERREIERTLKHASAEGFNASASGSLWRRSRTSSSNLNAIVVELRVYHVKYSGPIKFLLDTPSCEKWLTSLCMSFISVNLIRLMRLQAASPNNLVHVVQSSFLICLTHAFLDKIAPFTKLRIRFLGAIYSMLIKEQHSCPVHHALGSRVDEIRTRCQSRPV